LWDGGPELTGLTSTERAAEPGLALGVAAPRRPGTTEVVVSVRTRVGPNAMSATKSRSQEVGSWVRSVGESELGDAESGPRSGTGGSVGSLLGAGSVGHGSTADPTWSSARQRPACRPDSDSETQMEETL
jgi:hypothetical protein